MSITYKRKYFVFTLKNKIDLPSGDFTICTERDPFGSKPKQKRREKNKRAKENEKERRRSTMRESVLVA